MTIQAAQAEELVLRDLVDALIQEDVGGLAKRLRPDCPDELRDQPLASGERWCQADLDSGNWLAFRARGGGALQRYRLSRGPVWSSMDGGRVVCGAELVRLLAGCQPGARQLAADLRTAAEHAEVTLRAAGEYELSHELGTAATGPLPGELVTALRGRPFHPVARAAVGWTVAELARYGPGRRAPLGLAWVGVHRDRLRFGGAEAQRLPELLLTSAERALLDTELDRAGWEFVALPAHPWQLEQVLRSEFHAEFAAGRIVQLARELGSFHPTAALRTLASARESSLHIKLPLGVATLGATRLLPPRYLDNSDRAQRTMADLLVRDGRLAERVSLCDEANWCAWQGPDEFADPAGQLAAQLREYPEVTGTLLPMGAFAVPEHGPSLQDPLRFFRGLAEGFCELGLGFLRYGVLPELHGQNVLVALRDGMPDRFVLRDHDTLRLFPDWMSATGVPDPGYRIKPGGSQSLRLDSGSELLGYLQTLGFQVNLYAIAEALASRGGIPERTFWAILRDAISVAMQRLSLEGAVADTVRQALLAEPAWPSRQVLRPLLRSGRSAGVSMPAATGSAPNPLLASRRLAERAARQRLLNAYLRETAYLPERAGQFEVALTRRNGRLFGTFEHVSPGGHHEYGETFWTEEGQLRHQQLVELLLAELDAGQEHSDQVAASVRRTARYLDRLPTNGDPTRRAEQGLLLGHPFHPTPKGAPGLDDAYAPELGSAFRVHWYAVRPELLAEERIAPGRWTPEDADSAAPAGFGVLPVHPWQAGYLHEDPVVRGWLADGVLVPLGPRAAEVYPTSSVRTVCAPEFPTSWKLPLHVRITNFVRTNPPDHVRRALDAGRLIGSLRAGWRHEGFEVLLETGSRTVRHDSLAPEFSVLYRENPFAHGEQRARVLASLLEDRLDGSEPELLGCVCAAAGGAAPDPKLVAEWLRRYLRISLLPMLAVFDTDGISLEAHPQNVLLGTEDGWPARFYVRDMEGTSVSRQRAGGLLPAESPALYSEQEAWSRLRYNVIINQLSQLVYVLGRHAGAGEARLWRVVRESLRTEADSRYAHELLTEPTLPAKANLRSWCAGRQECPHYVDAPNPIREVG